MIPRATYRLQLNSKFTFHDATALVPYLAELGISHVYCSPYFRARPGSMHGYDVVDHNEFNPEIGTRADFETFVATLRAHEMGHIADFVPNHVGVGLDNAWWMDVLENGPESQYAQFFDIEWTASGKVLIPVLGDSYGAILDRGELQLQHDAEKDSFAVIYHEHRFPIARRDYDRARELLSSGKATDAESLHELLEAQAYRLAYWRVASDEINYRRFFDVNDLAALRMENEAVFETTHRLVFELLQSGKLDGLRIDHPDGLYNPAQYFERLQHRAASLLPSASHSGKLPLYLLVEKITAGFERLPETWPVHGTTGYNFTNVVNGLFVDAGAKGRLDRIYRAFIGEPLVWQDVAYDAKHLILETALASELNVLTGQLVRIARADRHTRDFTANNLRQALAEVIACFPVYRTYVTDTASAEDKRFIDWAIAVAKRRSSRVDTLVFEFVRGALLAETAATTDDLRRQVRKFAMKFQQVTAPVTAKGVEDTALYRFNRLASLNEVGGEPENFGTSVRAFHADARSRAKCWPHEMLATSTHDTKRSEDVRARMDVLSEMPSLWRKMLLRWSRMNRARKRDIDGRPAPGPNQEYLLYQILLGSWPLEPMDDVALTTYRERIEAYMLKAVREAKMRTSWSDVSAEYEDALLQFIRALLEPRETNLFLTDLLAMQLRITRFGLYNSLSQTLCKLTAPGMPDIYQGNEIWDFSLVDPDNRRPVDYERRREILAEIRGASQNLRSLLESINDGRAKLYLTWKVLQHRRAHEALFSDGEYIPARVSGEHANHLLAFARKQGSQLILAIVPRLYARLLRERDALPLGPEVWADTVVELPRSCRVDTLRNVLDATAVQTREDGGHRLVAASEALANFPVALLSGTTSA
jgi:(1->4)-alpha-D-glucan 1-alpha-D-glucosylmutase